MRVIAEAPAAIGPPITGAAALLRFPRLYPKQAAFVHDPARYTVCFASTKSGKSVGLLCWLLARAWEIGRPGRDFHWIAPTYPMAKIMFLRMQRWLQRADAPHEVWTANESEPFIGLANGSRIYFKGGENPDRLYGPDSWGVVIDEASRCKEGVWHAVRSTVTRTEAPIKIIGNMRGRRNWMFALYTRARSGEAGLSAHHLTAHDAVAAGILDAGEIEDARRQLPEAVFKELYLAEPSDDAGNPFGLDAIRACLVPALSDAPPVAWGWDLAKSVDHTAGVALDAAGAVCCFLRWQEPWRQTIDRIRDVVGAATPALVDSTGVGDPVLEALQDGRANFSGQKFTQTSKQQLMEGLAVAIQQGAVKFPDGPLRAELDAFEYVYTRTGVHYEAAPGMHDDCVCALALAVRRAARADPWDWGRAR